MVAVYAVEREGVMPVMTPDDLHRFLEEEFPAGAAGHHASRASTTPTIRVRQKTLDGHLRPGGTISGPTLMAMVDCGFYLLLLSRLGPVALAVTTNLNINFMRKPEPGDLLGEGRLLKLGKTLAVGDFTIWSEGAEGPGRPCHGDLCDPAEPDVVLSMNYQSVRSDGIYRYRVISKSL